MVSKWSGRGLYQLDWNRSGQVTCDKFSGDGPERQLDELLKCYFRSGRADFGSISIDPDGWTDLSELIYRHCRQIPPGETTTYGKLAELAGRPGASRAVGGAMARNRVLIVIPCHRVIASNGKLQGFSAPGGLQTKQALLDLEQYDVVAAP
jgi:methylated-DNA-[protein]-cysteine S-methyltransferase